MSRSGALYVIRTMERAARSDSPGVTLGAAVSLEGRAAARGDGRSSILVRRVVAALQLHMGGTRGTADRRRQRLDGTVPAAD